MLGAGWTQAVALLAAFAIALIATPAGVSGAVLLLPFQVSVLGTPSPAVTQNHNFEDKAFYPLTFPITAGPGCIVVMLTLSAHANAKTLSGNLLARAGLLLAAVVLSWLVYLCYAYAPQITRAIAPSTVNGILRVIAFILLCIGVHIAWNGLSPLLATLLHPA